MYDSKKLIRHTEEYRDALKCAWMRSGFFKEELSRINRFLEHLEKLEKDNDS